MKECVCRVPHPGYITENRPQGNQWCVCGGYINPGWVTNDQTTGAFYDRLSRTFPTGPDEDYLVFRAECQSREAAGRKTFGHRHLGRDNLMDARQEAADGANYLLFHRLQQLRAGNSEDGMDLILDGAQHFYRAYAIARALYRKAHSAPSGDAPEGSLTGTPLPW